MTTTKTQTTTIQKIDNLDFMIGDGLISASLLRVFLGDIRKEVVELEARMQYDTAVHSPELDM